EGIEGLADGLAAAAHPDARRGAGVRPHLPRRQGRGQRGDQDRLTEEKGPVAGPFSDPLPAGASLDAAVLVVRLGAELVAVGVRVARRLHGDAGRTAGGAVVAAARALAAAACRPAAAARAAGARVGGGGDLLLARRNRDADADETPHPCGCVARDRAQELVLAGLRKRQRQRGGL